MKTAKIEYEARGKQRSLHIPKLAEAEVEAIEGQGGKEVILSNIP